MEERYEKQEGRNGFWYIYRWREGEREHIASAMSGQLADLLISGLSALNNLATAKAGLERIYDQGEPVSCRIARTTLAALAPEAGQ